MKFKLSVTLAMVCAAIIFVGCGEKEKDPPKKTTSTTKTGGGKDAGFQSGPLVVQSPVAFAEVVKSTRVKGTAGNANVERVGWVLIDASKILEEGTIPITCKTKKIPCDGTFDAKVTFKSKPGNYTLDVFMLDPDDPKAQLERQEIPLTLYAKAPPKPVGGDDSIPEPKTGTNDSQTAPPGAVPPPAKLEDATG
jgi:hypothetical protein